MRKTEVKQLEYFLAVADNLSFTRAAEIIHVAQPAISQQIKQLERDLGVSLFHRDNKRVTLTEAGKLFRKHALDVLEKLDRGVRVIEELRGLARGTVSIGMSSTMATILMADLVHGFQQKFPHIKIKISETITSDSVNRLKEGELDLAIVSLPLPESTSEDNAIEVSTLYEENLELIVPASHELAKKGVTEIDLIEACQYDWILANNANTLRRIINDVCEQKGFSPFVKVEVDRISSVKNLLLFAERGITILPPTSVNYELSLGIFKRIKLKNVNISRGVGIISRPQAWLPPATVEMINFIKHLCVRYPERSYLNEIASSIEMTALAK